MKMKKILALLLSSVMIMGVFSSCAKTPKPTTTDSKTPTEPTESIANGDKAVEAAYTRNEKGYPDLKGETFNIWFALQGWQAKFTNDIGENKQVQKLQELLNCKFVFSHPPIGQERDNFAIMMAGGEWPDIVFCSGFSSYYPGGIVAGIEDGVVQDMTPYINETNTPNFQKKVMQDPTYKKWFSDDKNRVIKFGSKISGSDEADISFAGPVIRKKYLEATGLPLPVTMDDWTAMLTKMKENGVKYPLGLNAAESNIARGSSTFLSAYGITMNYFLKEDGKTVAYGPAEPAYKDYLTTMNKWYTNKLINPDFPTQTPNDMQSLMSSGEIGSMATHLATYQSIYHETTEKNNPDMELVPAQYPVLKNGEVIRLRPSSRNVGDDKTVTTKAKNPLACAYLLDAMYMDEVDTMLQYGTEGVTYKMDGDMPVRTILPDNTPKDIMLQDSPGQMHATEDATLKGVLYKYGKGISPAAINLWKQTGNEGLLPRNVIFSAEESSIFAKYSQDISTYVDEMMLKFIVGTEPLSNFDAYIAKLKSMHIDDLIAINQAAVERYNSRK